MCKWIRFYEDVLNCSNKEQRSGGNDDRKRTTSWKRFFECWTKSSDRKRTKMSSETSCKVNQGRRLKRSEGGCWWGCRMNEVDGQAFSTLTLQEEERIEEWNRERPQFGVIVHLPALPDLHRYSLVNKHEKWSNSSTVRFLTQSVKRVYGACSEDHHFASIATDHDRRRWGRPWNSSVIPA